MRREVPEEDLRRLYTANDMARTDCGGCRGCSQCCSGMGESVVLDPFDTENLRRGLGIEVPKLMESVLELNVVDGVILPNLRMRGAEERCTFLDENGRCRIHAFRPGVCRLFPMGRIYENGTFRYFLQTHECPKEPKTKIRISKWLGIPNLKKYEKFVLEWHDLLEVIRDLTEGEGQEDLARDLNTYLLRTFYLTPFDGQGDFYRQFEERYRRIWKLTEILQRQQHGRMAEKRFTVSPSDR